MKKTLFVSYIHISGLSVTYGDFTFDVDYDLPTNKSDWTEYFNAIKTGICGTDKKLEPNKIVLTNIVNLNNL